MSDSSTSRRSQTRLPETSGSLHPSDSQGNTESTTSPIRPFRFSHLAPLTGLDIPIPDSIDPASDPGWTPTNSVLGPHGLPVPARSSVASSTGVRGNKQTTLTMSASSSVMSNHDLKAVTPYLQEDIRDYMQSAPIDKWMEAVLGLDSALLESWASTADNWKAGDPVISTAMGTFMAAPEEKKRYEPFCTIANRILTLGKVHLKLPASAGRGPVDTDPPVSYPIPDIGFFRLDPARVTTGHRNPPPSDVKDAQRSPDVVCMRTRTSPGTKPRWAELLFTCEFKGPRAPKKKKAVTSPLALAGDPVNLSESDPQQMAPVIDMSGPVNLKRKANYDEVYIEELIQEEYPDDGDDSPPAKRRQTSHRGYFGALTDLEYEGTVQVASNTLEGATYSGGSRIHHIQLLLDDCRVLFFYCDASGMVKSQESWDFVCDFGKVAAALVALARCDVRRLGAFPHMDPPIKTPYPDAFPPPDLEQFSLGFTNDKDKNPVKLTLGKHLFSQYISIGRRTFVYDVTMDSAPPAINKDMILKVAQQARTRTMEWKLIETARAKGVEHIPEIHAYGTLHDLRKDPGTRKNLHEIFGVLDQGPNYEDRVVRAMVSTKYTTLEARLAKFPEDVMIMAEQMVNCLHDLRYKAFILHRDVSLANIMCEINERGPRFILNDFDLACHLDDDGEPKGATSNHRTGTLPFVAVDLLFDIDTLSPKHALRNPPSKTHRLRHDFESLFWTVLAGILLSQKEEASKDQWGAVFAELRQWEKGDLSIIADHKRGIIVDDEKYATLPLPPLFAMDTPGRWLYAFRGVLAAEREKFKEKSKALGGISLKNARLTETELDSIINKETILQALGTAHA